MTRDKADKIVRETTGFIDTLVALGVLKLDEPMSVEDRAILALWNKLDGPTSPGRVLKYLDDAGLKIVEK